MFAFLKTRSIRMRRATTYYKGHMRLELLPVSFNHGSDHVAAIPRGTGIVNLDRYPAPNLVIEVAKSSLLDDVGAKRSLYEELGVDEYWVVDVQNAQILAYAIADQGSK